MKILVSSCLLGMACRYSGQSKPSDTVIRLAQSHMLVPFCPEIYGGLPTPREPAEIRDGRVVTPSGKDVTAAFEKGAQEALRIAQTLGCDCAVLMDRSPSCGNGIIHDGTFTDGLTPGDGLTAALLKQKGIRVINASETGELQSGAKEE